MIEFVKSIQGHTVTLEVSEQSKGVVLYVDDSVDRVDGVDPALRLRLALAARQLWREALSQLPRGVYWCYPSSENRRRVYISAGWKPHPSPYVKGELVFYHGVPPLPGWRPE